MNNPWAFGWTQLFTIIGFIITILIAIGGFRSFERWRREKIEEKRIDTAIDALVGVRETKFVFSNIRSGMSFDDEWKDMPEFLGDDENKRRKRGSFFATLNRIKAHRDFFERAWKLQVRCGALFGETAEEGFLMLQKARREVEVSAGMLVRDPFPTVATEENLRTWEKFRSDVWEDYGRFNGIEDTVAAKLREFETIIEATCKPLIDRQFGKDRGRGLGMALSSMGL
jgi:hypothetical protein